MKLPKTGLQAGIYSSFKLFSKLIYFCALVVFARVAGASHFGVYTYLISLIYFMIPMSHFGMLPELTRRSKSKTLKFAEEAFLTYALTTILISSLVSIVVLIAGYSLVLATFSSLAFITICFLRFFTQTHMMWGRIRYISIAALIERITFSFMVLIFPQKTVFILMALITSNSLSALYLFRTITLKFAKKITSKFFSQKFFLSALFLASASRIPPIIYGARFSIVDLGNFGAALLLFQGVSGLISEAGSYIGARGGRFKKRQYQFMKKVSIFSAILIVMAAILMNPLITFFGSWAFGQEYVMGASLLPLMFLSLGPAILILYPSIRLGYNSPKKWLLLNLSYMLLAVIPAFIVPNIWSATVLKVIVAYIQVAFGWLLAETTPITTEVII